jgi:hypothetical protein
MPMPAFQQIFRPTWTIPALAVLLGATSAFALDLPARKPGLWEVSMSFDGRNLPPQITQQCLDAETDKMLNVMGNQMGGEICQKQDIKQSGSAIVVDAVCEIAGMKVTTHSEMTGDFNSAYTVKATSTTEGRANPIAGADGAMHMTIGAKWTGACAADQKPGDIVMSNGMKMNVREMQALMKNLPAALKKLPHAPHAPE